MKLKVEKKLVKWYWDEETPVNHYIYWMKDMNIHKRDEGWFIETAYQDTSQLLPEYSIHREVAADWQDQGMPSFDMPHRRLSDVIEIINQWYATNPQSRIEGLS